MSAACFSAAVVEPSDRISPPVDGSRHDLFRYLTAEESADYLAIMELFTATLLTDLSAAEVTTQLAERGVTLDRDIVEARCRQLVTWGNLVPSLRGAGGRSSCYRFAVGARLGAFVPAFGSALLQKSG
jgi:hypothetical protein